MKYLFLLLIILIIGCENQPQSYKETALEIKCIGYHLYGIARTYGGWPTYFPLFDNDSKPRKCHDR